MSLRALEPVLRRSLAVILAAAGTVAALLFASGRPAWTDDRDLLRFNTAKPYLFVLLDTSTSMNLALGTGDLPATGFGDDPASRIYTAKEALFRVFEAVDDVHFGFATFNQDHLGVPQKHYLYYNPTSLPASWPIEYPLPDVDGLTALDADGFAINDIEGDALAFGKTFPGTAGGPAGVAGSCTAPLSLVTDRARINGFAKLGVDGLETTQIWVRDGTNTSDPRYRLDFYPTPAAPVIYFDQSIVVTIDLYEVPSCSQLPLAPTQSQSFNLKRDPRLSEYLMVDDLDPPGGGNEKPETTSKLWDWSDPLQVAACGDAHPFSGKGWEGNYDSGVVTGDTGFDQMCGQACNDPLSCDPAPMSCPSLDKYCLDPQDPATCFNPEPGLKYPTVLSTFVGDGPSPASPRPLDRGDMLPFDWNADNRVVFLQRLAPNWQSDGSVAPDFRVASHFGNSQSLGTLAPLSAGRPPIVAAGKSPLSKAINDFRCWFLGGEGQQASQKCGRNPFYESELGWDLLACENDSSYGCRRPYLIIISDGEDNCAGEDANADIGSLKSHSGVRTWALNVGDPKGCNAGGGLHPIVTAGNGECVNVASKQQLLDVLEDVLGRIREETRAFASAAVPSVQASVADKIFLSSFTPLNDAAIWDGHFTAFLKPLPLADGKADTRREADGTFVAGCEKKPVDEQASCVLWDSGDALKDQVPGGAGADHLGPGENQRRVFYSRFDTSGTWAESRRLFDPVSESTPAAIRYDLFEALGVPYTPDQPPSFVDEAAILAANAVVSATLSLKTATVDNAVLGPQDLEYVLGDIFHSNPLIVREPTNSVLFATNHNDYRDFFHKHRVRRQMVLVGANDGMVHAFDAGIFRTSGPFADRYDNGTGHELWSYMPRSVMRTVRAATTSTQQDWMVDGALVAADVFIDPDHDGVPDEADREWRTVTIGGLREGGSGYFLLDTTQPDLLDDEGGVENVPQPLGGGWVPSCLGSLASSDNPQNGPVVGCGPVPYPSALWEFTDVIRKTGVPEPRPLLRLNEDCAPNMAGQCTGNTAFDLGDSWSSPNLGRIRVCTGSACDPMPADAADDDDLEERWVAVFGGGMDPATKVTLDPQLMRGNWVYMVDIETAQVLYKRRVDGPVASEVAAVDVNQDGYLDRLYVPTIAGSLYRVDLGLDSGGNVPALVDTAVTAFDETTGSFTTELVPRIPELDGAGEPLWEPQVLFDATFDAVTGTTLSPPRPLYHRPSVIFVANLGLYALAFGTGDREDLWSDDPRQGRFYVFVDDKDVQEAAGNPFTAYTEADLVQVAADGALLDTAPLLGGSLGQRGWYLMLDSQERVITNAFALAGITFFSTYEPRVKITTPGDDPDAEGEEVLVDCAATKRDDTDNFCGRDGSSRVFVVLTTNANSVLVDAGGQDRRWFGVDTFVTEPYTEQGQTQNPVSGDGAGADELTPQLTAVMEELKKLFPANCKFANYRIDIKTISSDTGVIFIAPVPVCIIEKNWKAL